MTEVVCKEAVEVPFIDAVKRAKSIRRPDFLLRHQFLFCLNFRLLVVFPSNLLWSERHSGLFHGYKNMTVID